MRRLAFLIAVCTAVAGFSVPAGARWRQCQVDDDHPERSTNLAPKTQDIAAFHGLKGHYALPNTKRPTTLIVMFHGYGYNSDAWVCHLLDAARNHNAVAVAMDYRGTGWAGPDGKAKPSDNRGWFVKEGAEDSLFAATYFLKRFPSISRVINFSVSMGANAGGLAQAAKAKRPDGKTPMFDYWFDIEGVTSLDEEYLLILPFATIGNKTAIKAQQDIEKECKGTLAANPACFRDLTVLFRTPDIVASRVKGALVMHSVDDGEVLTTFSNEMTIALRAAGIPTDEYSFARRNDWQHPKSSEHEAGDTLTGLLIGSVSPDAKKRYNPPLSGHGWEGRNTHIVIATAFGRLWSLLEKGDAPANHQYVVDSEQGKIRFA